MRIRNQHSHSTLSFSNKLVVKTLRAKLGKIASRNGTECFCVKARAHRANDKINAWNVTVFPSRFIWTMCERQSWLLLLSRTRQARDKKMECCRCSANICISYIMSAVYQWRFLKINFPHFPFLVFVQSTLLYVLPERQHNDRLLIKNKT